MKKEKLPNKKGAGRPKIYSEETEIYSVVVPKSKKPYIKEVIDSLLEKYKIKNDAKS